MLASIAIALAGESGAFATPLPSYDAEPHVLTVAASGISGNNSAPVAKKSPASRLWFPDNSVADSKLKVTCSSDLPAARIAAEEIKAGWKGDDVTLRINASAAPSPEGFTISRSKKGIDISSPSATGLLYGAYHLLRLQATGEDLSKSGLKISESPKFPIRILNHWDNPDGTIERGYAGHSLWDWDALPDSISPRYEEYARANASVGINATVLNNVNASPKVLESESLRKVKALADVFRPYGIKVWLSVNFASPMAIGSLSTADPLSPEVRKWWKEKADEIYSLIPDFGGFLVKANSEGQPGPCDFGRTHAEGANMLAEALKPHGGTVCWRAFVYSPSDADRAKQAYLEFDPLDGQFADNVIVQIKNGPIDFQPREPYSPLFTSLEHTQMLAELQVTQEYLGHANHLAFLAPMWTEFFSYVSPESLKGVAGVANVGDDENWCGNPLAQANWYAFGRLAWNPDLKPHDIAEEWAAQTFSLPEQQLGILTDMMTESRETVVDYMMPLGLHHIFAFGHHYGPEPWCEVDGARADWLPKYYHRADSKGLGFNRSPSGSNATAQYPDSLAAKFGSIDSCPEEFLLWFHHVPWNHRMKDGKTLWENLCRHYDEGCRKAAEYPEIWKKLKPYIDPAVYADVEKRLKTQAKDAKWWKDACLLYFAQFSGMPWPEGITPPAADIDSLKQIKLPISNYESPSPELLDSVR